jgi:hypothetical protein
VVDEQLQLLVFVGAVKPVPAPGASANVIGDKAQAEIRRLQEAEIKRLRQRIRDLEAELKRAVTNGRCCTFSKEPS